jgi:hypothetical protein
MALSIPAFTRFPTEAAVIGRLLVGYSELEYAVCASLVVCLADADTAVRVMFRTRGEEKRLEIADALMRHKFEAAGLANVYSEAMADAHWCRRVRNQYAHCLFDPRPKSDCLHFVSLEDTAKLKSGKTLAVSVPVELSLLMQQEQYFGYVQDCLFHMESEYKRRAGQSSSHDDPLPLKIARPPRHSALD